MSSKGLTPVIATVLLISISVAATASAYTFITTMQEQTQQHWEDQFSQQELESQSGVNIEYVYRSNDGYTILNIRNTGSIGIDFKDNNRKRFNLYVDGRPIEGGTGWKFLDNEKQNDEDVILHTQETIAINTTEEFPSEGEDRFIRLFGPYDTGDAYVCYNSGDSSC